MVPDSIPHDPNKHIQEGTLPLQTQEAVNTKWQICQMCNMPAGE